MDLSKTLDGKITGGQSKVGHFNDTPEILQFVNANHLEELASLGTSCPDHFLRTKICPLVVNFDPVAADVTQAIDATAAQLDEQVAAYRALEHYRTYRDGDYAREDTRTLGSFAVKSVLELARSSPRGSRPGCVSS